MSNQEVETMKVHQEIATRNSKEAIAKSEKTRDELLDRINRLERLVTNQEQKITQMEQKYNLLLTARFDGRSTAG